MPYKYIGRTTSFKGKTLWEIIGNLKNFGVGRMVVRSVFERYPEPSYMKIVKVETDPYRTEQVRKVRVWVEKVFRGRIYPLTQVYSASYKTDYRLIPRDEEEDYMKGIRSTAENTLHQSPYLTEERVLPSTFPIPPLLAEVSKSLLRKRGIIKEVPTTLPLKIKDGSANRAKVSEIPDKVTVSLGQISAPRLYEGVK